MTKADKKALVVLYPFQSIATRVATSVPTEYASIKTCPKIRAALRLLSRKANAGANVRTEIESALRIYAIRIGLWALPARTFVGWIRNTLQVDAA